MEGVIGKHNVKPIEAIRSGTRDSEGSLLRKAVPLPCPQHKGEVFKYHCVVCDLLMCQACTVGKDSPHCPTFISAEVPLLPQHLQAVELAQKVASSSKEQCRVARETAEGWVTEVERKKEAVLRDIQQSFQAIHAAVDHRKEELCDQVRAVSEARKETVTDTIHTYRQKEDTLSNKQAMLSFLSTEGSPHEVISYRRVVDARLTHCRSEVAVSRVMQFLPKQEATLQATIKEFGCVEVGACPANCTLEPAPDKVCRWSGSDGFVFTLTTTNREKISCSVGGESVQAFLRPRPPIPGPSIKAEVNDEENGQYKVTFDLTYTGECQLSVLVNGVHIQGSPFAVEFNPDSTVHFLLTRSVDTLGACKGDLLFPKQPGKLTGVAVAPNGTKFVTDYDNCKIHVFDAARKFVKSFGEHGKENGQLQSPMSAVITSQGLLYIANGNRVDVLTENGDFVHRIGIGILKTPYDVTVHNGDVFVADSGNNRVAVFSEDGKFSHTIGSKGTGAGQFQFPVHVAISPDGELYVSDCSNHRIQVFTTQGAYIREFGNRLLWYPHKVLFTGDKHVLIADQNNNRIVAFNQGGELVKSVACVGLPRALAVDESGDLLVACYHGRCVCVF